MHKIAAESSESIGRIDWFVPPQLGLPGFGPLTASLLVPTLMLWPGASHHLKERIMRSRIRFLALCGLSLAATLATGTARAQFIDDWQHVAAACAPSTLSALSMVQINTSNGSIRANNPNSGTVRYTCNVLDSFATSVPTWNYLTLQYQDTVGGRVVATLYAKSKATGAAVVMAIVASPAVGGIANVSVPLPGLDFAANAHYVVITLQQPTANNPPQAHMVSLHQ
jgi:hypothetical protein